MFHVLKGHLGDEYEMDFSDYGCSRYSELSYGDSMWTTDAIDDLNARLNDKADTSAVTESINAAISGKADTSAVTASINAAVSGKVDTSAITAYSTTVEVGGMIDAATSGKVDTSTFNTYSGSVETALSGKQDTLTAGSGITISGNVISATGGGKAISAGRGITVTTGETADTVSFNLPIRANTSGDYILNIGSNNSFSDGTYNGAVIGIGNGVAGGGTNRSFKDGYIIGSGNTLQCLNIGGGSKSVSIGFGNKTYGAIGDFVIGKYNVLGNETQKLQDSYVIGDSNKIITSNEDYGYFIIGKNNSASTRSWIIGSNNATSATNEFAIGMFNNSSNDGTSSGTTFFSIGDGTANNARHNAFEIRQNGDIYFSLNGQDVKLQDQLGGGITSGDVQSMISAATSGYTERFAEDEEVTAAALNALNDNFGGLKLVKLTQQENDALVTKDNNVLYIIIN